MTSAAVTPGDIADHRNGAGPASGRMIAEDRVADDEPAVVVHVEETISPALAGHEGVVYESPPLARADALALVRVLIGRDCRTAERNSWRCAIAGGQRTITLKTAPAAGIGAKGREISDRDPTMNDRVRLIAGTDQTGLHVDAERLARAGIKPGSRAVIEIRPYTEEDWVADGERTFQSGAEFLAYLGVCPSHAQE
jgi:hypothetical protein